MFNVVKQSIQYEPSRDFIVKWIPELENCPEKFIHTPWEWSGIEPGSRYANPLPNRNAFYYEVKGNNSIPNSKNRGDRIQKVQGKKDNTRRKDRAIDSKMKKQATAKSAQIDFDLDF